MSSISILLFPLALKAALVFASAHALTFALGRASASARRLIWAAAILCALAIPLFTVILPPMKPVRAFPPVTSPYASVEIADRVIVTHASPPHSISRPPWIAIFWTAGMLAVLIRLLIGNARIWWLMRDARRPTISGAVKSLCTDLGVRVPALFESPGFPMPMTWGVFRPAILLPAAWADWPAARQRLVLAHELTHIRESDCLLQWLSQIVCALYWFHPLAWTAASQFRKERERACDDGVLNLGVPGPEYAEQLLEVAKSMQPRCERWSMAIAMAHSSHFEGRLIALLDSKTNRQAIAKRTSMVVFAAALLMTVPLAMVRAQTPASTGSIRGAVHDASGAVVPYAAITASNADTHTIETAHSGAAGEYSFESIPTGHYIVEVKKPDFAIFQQKDLVLGPNAALNLNPSLAIGGIREAVTVLGKGQPTAPAPVQGSIPQRVRVGGNVQAAKLIGKVQPIYPPVAESRGVQGTVLLQAVIGKEGEVLALKVLNTLADPELANAARDAVQQWRYQPTLLNGQPVEVVTTITIDFRLEQ